ncbi:hypothetical protein V499_07265 [Pseudogymnoascus sp. VKM F-103]|nr:hypothetical protein V499_07265 [Pseudogymnoascus sp. VKM F-103]
MTDSTSTPDLSQTPFVKQLASPDRQTRTNALDSLRTYLSGRRSLPQDALLKLHTALFYTMWLTDRPLPQQSLAASLAALPAITHTSNRTAFTAAFWTTMAREWTRIDVLRMEKFLLLTRRYVGAAFGQCADKGWEAGVVEEQMRVLREGPLEPEARGVPNGMRYHVIDVWVDELERAGGLGEKRKGVELEVLLEPLKVLGTESPTKSVRKKCKEALADERLPGNEKEDVVMEEDEGWGGFAE